MIAIVLTQDQLRLSVHYYEDEAHVFRKAATTGRFHLSSELAYCSPEVLQELLEEAAQAIAGDNQFAALVTHHNDVFLLQSALADYHDSCRVLLQSLDDHFPAPSGSTR